MGKMNKESKEQEPAEEAYGEVEHGNEEHGEEKYREDRNLGVGIHADKWFDSQGRERWQRRRRRRRRNLTQTTNPRYTLSLLGIETGLNTFTVSVH